MTASTTGKPYSHAVDPSTPGPKRKLTDSQVERLMKALREPAGNSVPGALRWSVQAVQDFLYTEFNIKLSVKGAWLYLKRSAEGGNEVEPISRMQVCASCRLTKQPTEFSGPRSLTCFTCRDEAQRGARRMERWPSGRVKDVDERVIDYSKLLAAGVSLREVADHFGISKHAVYLALKVRGLRTTELTRMEHVQLALSLHAENQRLAYEVQRLTELLNVLNGGRDEGEGKALLRRESVHPVAAQPDRMAAGPEL